MKKISILLSSMSLTINAFAQSFTQTNEPIIGDSKTMFVCDSFVTDYANITGASVTWDYSALTSYVGMTKTMEIVAPSATPYAADFPNATAVTKIQGFTYTFMNSSATERSSVGYVLENTGIGVVKAKFSGDDQLLMNYPANLTANVVDPFSGNLSFTSSGFPQNPVCTGNSNATYDGYGTLLLPNSVVLTNISRFRIQDTLNTTVPVFGASQILRSQFEYYQLSGTDRLPVFLHISAKLVSGFPEPLIDQTVVLSQTQGAQTASLNEKQMETILIFPNPSKSSFSILGVNENAQVELQDVTGRNHKIIAENGQYDLREITSGIYIVKITDGNHIITKTLLKE